MLEIVIRIGPLEIILSKDFSFRGNLPILPCSFILTISLKRNLLSKPNDQKWIRNLGVEWSLLMLDP